MRNLKNYLNDKYKITVVLVLLIYSLVNGLCLIFAGDDFMWSYFKSIKCVYNQDSRDGRYFSNTIMYLMTHNMFYQVAFYFVFMFLFYWIFSKIIEINKKKSWISFAVTSFIFFSISNKVIINSSLWMAGFTNYVISIFFSMIYIFYCSPLFQRKQITFSKKYSVLTFFIGFFGAMCLEVVTIYNIIVSIAVIIVSIKMFKKINFACITYFIGTIIGAVLMFSDHNYHDVASEGGDQNAYRHIEFGVNDIFAKVYGELLQYFAKPYWILHFIIVFSFVYLAVKKYEDIKTKKYFKLTLGICIFFAIYSLITQYSSDFVLFSSAYRMQAIETAFTFVYMISIIYLAYILLPKDSLARVVFYVLSILISIAPYFVVNPVSPRCFYTSFVFWALTACEIAMFTINEYDLLKFTVLKRSLMTFIIGLAGISMIFVLSNKYVDVVRIKHLKNQFENNEKRIELIELPYPEYATDTITLLEQNEESNSILKGNAMDFQGYIPFILYKYGIDENTDLSDKVFVDISIFDYNME